VDSAVSELNGRESLTWADVKISTSGYDPANGDTKVWGLINKDLGPDYPWESGSPSNSALSQFKFKSEIFGVSRIPSDRTRPGQWVRK